MQSAIDVSIQYQLWTSVYLLVLTGLLQGSIPTVQQQAVYPQPPTTELLLLALSSSQQLLDDLVPELTASVPPAPLSPEFCVSVEQGIEQV
jgi:hypothetical protein